MLLQRLTLLTLSLIVSLFAGLANAQMDEPVSKENIFDDARMLMVFHPQKVAAMIGGDNEDVKYIHDFTSKMSKLKTGNLTEIAFQFAADAEAGNPGEVLGIVMRFDEDVNQDAFIDNVRGQENSHQDKTYYKAEFGEPAFLLADKTTILVAEEARVQKHLENGSAKSDDLVQHLKTEDHFSGYVDFTEPGMVEVVEQLFAEMPNDVSDIASEHLDKIESAYIRVQLDSETPLMLDIKGKEAADLDGLQTSMEDWLESLRDLVADTSLQLEAAPPNISEPAAELLDSIAELLEAAEVKRDGSTISIKAEKMGGAKEIAVNAVATVTAVMQMFEGMMPADDF